MITYKNKYLSFGMLFYDEIGEKNKTVDIVKEIEFSKPSFYSTKFTTIQIDLLQDCDVIFIGFEKNTRYEINRALKKDEIIINELDPNLEKEIFYNMYTDFSKIKNLKDINHDEIDLLINAGCFRIRLAYDKDKNPLVCHTYIIANKKARLAHSISFFRNELNNEDKKLIGRANRLLHWEDIKLFKDEGFYIYDLGGISTDENNIETQSINKFKKSFGGFTVVNHNSLIPTSIKGFVFILYRSIKRMFS